MKNDAVKFEDNLESLGYYLAIMATQGKCMWFLLGDPTTRIITDMWPTQDPHAAILHRYNAETREWVEQGRYTETDIAAAAEQHNFVAMADPALIETAALLQDTGKVKRAYAPRIAGWPLSKIMHPDFQDAIACPPPESGREQIFICSQSTPHEPIGQSRVRAIPDGQGDAQLHFETKPLLAHDWQFLHTTTLSQFRTGQYNATTEFALLTAATANSAAAPTPPSRAGTVGRILSRMRKGLSK